MKLIINTPSQPDSKAGNRATAERWKMLLEKAGHTVEVVTQYHGETCDMLLALHAWRSIDAIRRFRDTWPRKPLIVALTGTDIYRHQYEYPDDTRFSMTEADALIGLHDLVANDIPDQFAEKLICLYQSTDEFQFLPVQDIARNAGTFTVCVIGHLRDEKDSLRAAYAARLLPETSAIRVVCAGKAHNEEWQQKAEFEMSENPRFQWLGQIEKAGIRQLMVQSQVMVISSVMEGGANVISEACRAGLPVIASDIPGNIGLLGRDYAGYFPVGDEGALCELLYRAEIDPGFLATLKNQTRKLAERFVPEKELASLKQALRLAMQGCSERL